MPKPRSEKDYRKAKVGDMYATYPFKPGYNVSVNLSVEQEEALNQVLLRYFTVWDGSDPAGLSYPKACQCVMRILTTEEPDFYIRPYRQAQDKIRYIHRAVEQLEKAGIIEKLPKHRNCKCCSSLLALPKPGAPPGILRLAHDLRPLNRITLPSLHGLPNPLE